MKIKIISLFFLFVCLFNNAAQAQDAAFKEILSAYQNKDTTIGVSIYNTKTKKELFSCQGHTPMNPASTMKIITSVVALETLGGSYKYNTVIATDSVNQNTAYNLYIKGMGDPSVVEERLWRMAKDLKVRGIEKVEGNIIIDNSYFDGFDFTGQDDDSSRAYNAKLSAFAVNFNSFAVVAKNFGTQLEVRVDPPTDLFNLKSTIKNKGDSLSISRSLQDNIEYVTATGGVSDEKIKYANVSDPVQYAGTTLAWVLKQMGISFSGKIRSGTAKGNVVIVKDKSKELSLILRDLNKFSNNFTAEMVLKTLAAKKVSLPGSTEKGVGLLKNFLQNIEANSNEYAIYNGSGLSRRNRVSPDILNQTLIHAYQNNKIRSDFISTLSIAGTDGTLHSRLKSPALTGNVKAKTGTLSDVSSLSGYMETKAGTELVFTIMVNGPAAGAGKYFSMQEKLLSAAYDTL